MGINSSQIIYNCVLNGLFQYSYLLVKSDHLLFGTLEEAQKRKFDSARDVLQNVVLGCDVNLCTIAVVASKKLNPGISVGTAQNGVCMTIVNWLLTQSHLITSTSRRELYH